MDIPIGYSMVRHYFTSAAVSREAMLSYGIVGSGGMTPTEAAEALYEAWDAMANQTQHSSAVQQRCEVQVGPSPAGPTGIATGASVGGQGGAAMSPQVAILVKKLTAFGGRSQRGRFYIPFVSEDQVDGAGHLTITAQESANLGIDNWVAALDTLTITPVLLHEGSGDPTIITDWVLNPIVATQRKRLKR